MGRGAGEGKGGKDLGKGEEWLYVPEVYLPIELGEVLQFNKYYVYDRPVLGARDAVVKAIPLSSRGSNSIALGRLISRSFQI